MLQIVTIFWSLEQVEHFQGVIEVFIKKCPFEEIRVI